MKETTQIQTKYLQDGRAVSIDRELNPGYLVREIFEGEDGDWTGEKLMYVESVFDEAPTPQLDKRIADLNSTIESLREVKSGLESEIATIKTTEKPRFDKYKKYQQLQQLDDFIDGKITHYVHTRDYGDEVWITENKEEKFHDGIKLLSLFGKSNGDLTWRLHEYSDTSGGSNFVIPCTSLEQAEGVVRRIIEQKIKDTAANPRVYFVEMAKKYGATVPLEYVAACASMERARAAEAVAEAEKKLAELKRKLS